MIVDTSALVAILRREEDADRYVAALAAADRRGERLAIGAATLFELMLVIDRLRDPELSTATDRLIQLLRLEIVDASPETAAEARLANQRYGKGFHPARLNFGDCFAYALARQTGEPLLFKGDDFAQTDVVSAV